MTASINSVEAALGPASAPGVVREESVDSLELRAKFSIKLLMRAAWLISSGPPG